MSENKEFTIRVRGKRVPVTEEVFYAYHRSKRRDRYYERDIKTESAVRDKDGNVTGYKPAIEDSFNRIEETGEEFAHNGESVEDAAIAAVMGECLHEAISLLEEDERAFIEMMYFSNDGEGMTEREYAEIKGIPHTTVHSRKVRILVSLKKLLGK